MYLSSSIPYVLLYIWDAGKTSYSKKWVTGWIRDGIAHYEEQFPGQLNLSKLSRAEIEAELLRDREILQHNTDIPVVGHAFPFGATGKNVNCILKENDFLYARTVMNTMGYSKKRFTFPDDSLKLNPTCWHIDKDIEKLLDIFLSTPAENEDMLFYMWGHGYELDFEAMKRRKFWDTFERMLDKVACDDSVIKCTNAEAVRAHLSNEI